MQQVCNTLNERCITRLYADFKANAPLNPVDLGQPTRMQNVGGLGGPRRPCALARHHPQADTRHALPTTAPTIGRVTAEITATISATINETISGAISGTIIESISETITGPKKAVGCQYF